MFDITPVMLFLPITSCRLRRLPFVAAAHALFVAFITTLILPLLLMPAGHAP